ncbi:MAG: metallophosphoesterase [Gammaproteobacteria bacterium]|nr:metallophosphoesterase [Gammaproteobacteria bacterium]
MCVKINQPHAPGGHRLKTYLIISDLHIPYACPRYLRVISKVLKAIKFDGLVQLGDALDAFQISTYDKDPARKNTILDDINEWNELLTKWSTLLYSGAEIHLLTGNHEHRLEKYISRNARDIFELVRPWSELLRIKLRNETSHCKWFLHPYTKWNSCRIGDCVLMHGFYFNQHTAATNLAKYKTSVICGHTHRVQMVSDGTHYSATLGHGSDEHVTAHQPTPTGWTNAFGILTKDLDDKTSLEIITVKDGTAYVRGQKIKG